MSMFQVNYVIEDPSKEYAKAIRKAETLEELRETLVYYVSIAPDAYDRSLLMNEIGFKDFKTKLKYAGRKMPQKWTEEFIDNYGDIVLPRDMMMASLLANQFHAPWGTAFIRHKELQFKKEA